MAAPIWCYLSMVIYGKPSGYLHVSICFVESVGSMGLPYREWISAAYECLQVLSEICDGLLAPAHLSKTKETWDGFWLNIGYKMGYWETFISNV